MATTTVRIKSHTRELLRELAVQTGQPHQELLARALEIYRRHLVLEETNSAYAALRADEGAWADERQEREAWEATLADGLE